MGFDWTQYLVLAEVMHKQIGQLEAEEEAICRCAVSRAYYAAFCHARNYARSYHQYELPDYRNVNSHDHLIEFFKERMGMVKLGSSLQRLKEWRKFCDYCDTIPPGHSMLTMPSGAFTYARDVIDQVYERQSRIDRK